MFQNKRKKTFTEFRLSKKKAVKFFIKSKFLLFEQTFLFNLLEINIFSVIPCVIGEIVANQFVLKDDEICFDA